MEKIEYLEVHITDSCNLNCRGCSHCAGLIGPGQHIPYASFCKDMVRLQELVPNITKIRLLGGEPFLNPDIARYISTARGLYPASDIRVVTNGLLCLHLAQDVFQAMKDNDICLDVSCYPPTEKIREDLEKRFRAEGIRYQFTPLITQFGKRVNLQGDSDPEEMFWQCDSKWCHFLRNGMISGCPAPAIFDVLHRSYGVKVETRPYQYDIHDRSIDAAQLIEKLNAPSGMCAYCTYSELFAWESGVRPKLGDWVVK